MSVEGVLLLILILAAGYLLMGLSFVVILFVKGLASFDSAARDSGWGFKLLIIPGSLVFWPFLWKKWKSHDIQAKK